MTRAWWYACVVGGATFVLSTDARSDTCTGHVGFFNGVRTTPEGARRARNLIASQYGCSAAPGVGEYAPLVCTIEGRDYTFDYYYNDTRFLLDFIEVFRQRADEELHDNVRWVVFWELLDGRRQSDVVSKLLRLYAASAVLINNLYVAIKASAVQAIAAAVPQPTLKNYEEHERRLSPHVAGHEPIILVAHSQGNLFMNAAYDYVLGKPGYGDGARLWAVHIAPASATLRGNYTLASGDVVINGLRLFGGVPDVNVDTPFNAEEDPLGHGLSEIYLNPKYNAYALVKSHLDAPIKFLRETDAGSACLSDAGVDADGLDAAESSADSSPDLGAIDATDSAAGSLWSAPEKCQATRTVVSDSGLISTYSLGAGKPVTGNVLVTDKALVFSGFDLGVDPDIVCRNVTFEAPNPTRSRDAFVFNVPRFQCTADNGTVLSVTTGGTYQRAAIWMPLSMTSGPVGQALTEYSVTCGPLNLTPVQ